MLKISDIETRGFILSRQPITKDADQTEWIRRLICIFVVRIWHQQVFLWHGSFVGYAYFPHYMGRRLFPDVCSCPVSQIASVDVCSEGMCFACSRLFFSKRLGFSETDEVKYRNALLSYLICYSYRSLLNRLKNFWHLYDKSKLGGHMFVYRHKRLTGSQLHQTFPQFETDDSYVAVYQKDAGLVDAALANAIHIQLARGNGAVIEENCSVTNLHKADNGFITVRTIAGFRIGIIIGISNGILYNMG